MSIGFAAMSNRWKIYAN